MLNHFLENISSYDGNVLLAAIVSLLLVILFVLLLHVYAQWFLAQARQRRSRSSMSVSHVLLPAHRFHHFHSFNFDNNTNTTIWRSSLSKGLEASLIASIPLFVYTSSEYKQGLECVICLSAFEESDVGRSLPKCGHAFHVECIDMWLQSHSNCPICRAPVFGEKKVDTVDSVENTNNNNNNNNNESINSIEAAVNVELLEIVVEERDPRVERLNDASNCDHEVGINDSLSTSASGSVASSSSSSSLGCSLKRMLSRNRSDQCKVFRSSTAINVN